MKFDNANIKAVKEDLVKGEITISFVIPMGDQEHKDASYLAQTYVDTDMTAMTVNIQPRQQPLL